jgi:antitoxin HicB
MNILQYPAVFQPEEVGYSVSFPDFPEAFTQGENGVDAFDQAIDCLEEAVANRIALKMEIPAPTASKNKRNVILIPLTARAAVSAALYEGMKNLSFSRVQLAAIAGVDEKQVRRWLDPFHSSRYRSAEEALAAVGKRIVVSIEDINERSAVLAK